MPGEPDISADGAGDHRIVAGQHDGVLYSPLMQRFDHLTALVADLVRIGHEAGELSVDCDVEARKSALVEAGAIERRFVSHDIALTHEALIADMDIIAVDL